MAVVGLLFGSFIQILQCERESQKIEPQMKLGLENFKQFWGPYRLLKLEQIHFALWDIHESV